MISTLPDVLLHSILSFCDYKDTLNVATMDTTCLDAVEAFSRSQLVGMQETHQVDASWNYRLGMQANVPRDRLPPTLSNRHMLKVARQTHLYSLGGREYPHDCTDLCVVDENTIVGTGHAHGDVLRVWDVNTQRCVRSWNIYDGPFACSHVYCVGGLIVSIHENGNTDAASIYIWNVEGILQHTIELENFFFDCAAASDSQLFICSHTHGLGFTHSRIINDPETEAVEQAGIYVLRWEDWGELTAESILRRRFRCMVGSDTSGVVAAVSAENEICILKIENGDLLQLRSFIHQYPSGHLAERALFLLETRLYLSPYCGDGDDRDVRSAVDVVDITTGDHIQSLRYSTFDPFSGRTSKVSSIVTNGAELFCSFRDGTDPTSVPGIRAYPI